MAENQYINKVELGNDTLMDLTQDTVTPSDVATGATFHDASGAQRTGSLPVSTFQTKTGDTKDNVATFTESSARENINSGEKLSVLFGKIKKWFSSLGTAAFTNSTSYATSAQGGKADTALQSIEIGTVTTGAAGSSASATATTSGTTTTLNLTIPRGDTGQGASLTNNLTATVAGTALDATQGKVLNDKVTTLNSNLGGLQFRNNNGSAEWKVEGADTWSPFKSGGISPISVGIYRSEVVFFNNANKISFDYDWPASGNGNYRTNVQVAVSNDKSNWTEIFNAGATYQAKSGNSGILDISGYKYLRFYSTTSQCNYLATASCYNLIYA